MVEQGEPVTLDSLATLPTGLDGIYLDFLQRLVRDPATWAEVGQVLGLVAVAQAPRPSTTTPGMPHGTNRNVTCFARELAGECGVVFGVDVSDRAVAELRSAGLGLTGGARGRGVLEGAFCLLEMLARANHGIGLSELARDAGLPKASAYRLLEQLVDLGAVERYERRYYVGQRLARLGTAWQLYPWLHGAAREPVRLLSTLTPVATCVTVLHEDRVRVVAGTRGVVTEIPRLQPHDEFCMQTAAGRALLLSSRMAGDDPPAGFTLAEWRRARAGFRRSGSVVVDQQEVLPGVCCVATPVLRPDGEVVASVSALVVKQSVPAGLTELVVRASREITRNLARMTPVH